MEISSKFRTLFLIRKNLFFLLFVSFVLLVMLHDLQENISETITMAVLFLCISLFIQYIRLSSINKIIISDTGIRKIAFLSREEEFIPFSSIESLRSMRVPGMHSPDSGQITGGYFQSELLLTNKKKLLISPDHFENYQELIVVIRQSVC